METGKEFKNKLKYLVEYRVGENTKIEEDDNSLIDSVMLGEDEGNKSPEEPKPSDKKGTENIKNTAPKPDPAPKQPIEKKDNSDDDIKNILKKQIEDMNNIVSFVKTSFGELDKKLGAVGELSQKVNQIQQEIKEAIPPTPEEQMDLISKETYPYNLKLSDVWKGYFNDDNQESTDKEKEFSFHVDDVGSEMSQQEAERSFMGL